MNYTAVVDGEAGGYGAWFPDLSGRAAMGSTIDELILNAEVEHAIREGALPPDVPLIPTTGKPVKANLSLDAGVLAAIDAEARRRGLTRSALVEWLARISLPRTVF